MIRSDGVGRHHNRQLWYGQAHSTAPHHNQQLWYGHRGESLLPMPLLRL